MYQGTAHGLAALEISSQNDQPFQIVQPDRLQMPEPKKSVDEAAFDLFRELSGLPDRHPPRVRIAIVSTPRCGSSFFCQSLAGTGHFGLPREWLNARLIQSYARLFNLQQVDMGQYLRFVLAKTTSANGVFAVKFHVEHHMYWQKLGFDIFSMEFDRVYHVYRKDKLAQALSLAKARLTDQWSSERRPARSVPVDQIPTSDVLGALHHLSLQDEYLASHLASRIHRGYCYEDYMASDSVFREILLECGVLVEDGQKFSSDLQIQRELRDRQKLLSITEYLGFLTGGRGPDSGWLTT